MTRAMLLCAGKGTRLGPLSLQRPKPLLPVCNIPILRYSITRLVAQGVSDIVINLHYQGEMIKEELGNGSDLGANIQYSEEDTLLGTGGGLKQALALLDPNNLDEAIISMNGKLIFEVDIKGLLKSFHQSKDSLGTMVVQPAPNAMQWGAVDVQPESSSLRVHNILGKGSYMFCGVHVTRPSVLRKIPAGEACMVRQGYLPWIQEGKRVSAFVHQDGYFAEHSTPKRYLQSNIDLLRKSSIENEPGIMRGVSHKAQLASNVKIVQPVRIGANAIIGLNTQIGPNTVIGEGATVLANTTIQNSVVWPFSTAQGHLQEVIVTPNGVIPATGNDEVDR